MLSKKTIGLGLAVVLLVALVGCAKAPQQAIDAAKAAIEAAKGVEADRYAAEQFNAAQDTLDAAMAEIDKQSGKFALTRSYSTASKLLAAATTTANAAKDAAVANKQQVQVEAQQLLADAQAAIDAAKGLMKKAPRGKEGRAALEAMQTDLGAIEASLAEVNTAMASGDYLTARDKANASLGRANSIAEELKMAIEKKKSLAGKSR